MRVKTLVVAGFLCTFLLTGEFVMPGTSQPPKKKITGRLPNYWRQVGLSKDQVTQIYKIQADYRVKVEALEKQIEQLRVQEKQEMVKVLTDAQKEKLRQIYLKKIGLDPLKKNGASSNSP